MSWSRSQPQRCHHPNQHQQNRYRACDQNVATAIAQKLVVPLFTRQNVVEIVAGQDVVSATAKDVFDISQGIHAKGARRRARYQADSDTREVSGKQITFPHRLAAPRRKKPHRARRHRQGYHCGSAMKQIIAGAGLDGVVAAAAKDLIAPIPRTDRVIAAIAYDLFICTKRLNEITEIGQDKFFEVLQCNVDQVKGVRGISMEVAVP